jgi:hypothetical protein
LSYRTGIGEEDYKLHLLYNLVITPDTITYASVAQDPNLTTFSWEISATPQSLAAHRPTAHIILDSAQIDPRILAVVESALYGSSTDDPKLPTFDELLAILFDLIGITITDNGDGTWTATGPDDLITMVDPTTFSIDGANVIYLDSTKYQISTTQF